MTASHDDPRPRRLLGIQALRGLAAVAVVAYHAARHLDQALDASALTRFTQPGHAGVDLFFVLSGFIILHVHRRDIGRPDMLGHYAWQRFVRLMPIYWIALAATIATMLVGHADEVTAARVALSATLLPVSRDPLLGVAWTLQHEMLFYGAFALLLIHRALGLSCLALWLLWGAAQASGALSPTLDLPRFTSLFNVQFLFGMAAALAAHSGRIGRGGRMAACGGLLLVAVGVLEASGRIDGYGSLARLAYGVPSALLIAGLARWEGRVERPIPRTLVFVGEASYSLYLFHLLGIGIAWQIWLRSGIDTAARLPACFLFLMAGALACGFGFHLIVEAPLLRWLRSLSPGRQKATSTRTVSA